MKVIKLKTQNTHQKYAFIINEKQQIKGKLKCVYFSYYRSPGDVLNMNTSKVKETVLCRSWETLQKNDIFNFAFEIQRFFI